MARARARHGRCGAGGVCVGDAGRGGTSRWRSASRSTRFDRPDDATWIACPGIASARPATPLTARVTICAERNDARSGNEMSLPAIASSTTHEATNDSLASPGRWGCRLGPGDGDAAAAWGRRRRHVIAAETAAIPLRTRGVARSSRLDDLEPCTSRLSRSRRARIIWTFSRYACSLAPTPSDAAAPRTFPDEQNS